MADRVITGGKPDPDPTLLTTQALLREIGSIKELFEAKLNAHDDILNVISKDLGDRQEVIDAAVIHLTTLFEVKFEGVEKQFIERDKRTEQLSLADKTAIAAALQAQKEAAGAQNESNAASVTKQEAAFTKLLDQNQTLFQTAMSALTTQLNDVKSRLDKGEGHSRGANDLWGWIVGTIGLLTAVGALLTRHS